MTSTYRDYHEATLVYEETPYVLSIYNGKPDAPTLLFLPGTMIHPLFYDRFLSAIATAGINVIGLHFIGHGKSPRVRERFTFSDLVGNARHALEHCRLVYGENLIVMGSSQGSMVAVEAVRDMQVRGLFLHDLALPQLKESIDLLKLPPFLRPLRRPLTFIARALAWLFPSYPVKLQAYLNPQRITGSEALVRAFFADELSRKSYPLSFVVSLLTLNLQTPLDGSLKAPVVMIRASKDRLFTKAYMDLVYSLIEAPSKEMLTFESSTHTLFIEGGVEISDPVIEKLQACFS